MGPIAKGILAVVAVSILGITCYLGTLLGSFWWLAIGLLCVCFAAGYFSAFLYIKKFSAGGIAPKIVGSANVGGWLIPRVGMFIAGATLAFVQCAGKPKPLLFSMAIFGIVSSFAATIGLSIYEGMSIYGEEGAALLKQRKYPEALEKFDRAISIWATPGLLRMRGWSHFKVGEDEKALADLNKSIQMYESDAAAYEDRAAVYMNLGKTDLSEADLQKAKQLDARQIPGDSTYKPAESEADLD